MLNKDILRNKFLKKRKKKHRKVKNFFFDPLKKIIKKINKTSIYIAIYMPINYELDSLLSMNIQSSKKIYFLAPKVTDKNNMNFFDIKKNDVFQVNKYGILEPIAIKKKSYLPDIILLPLLAYDKNKLKTGSPIIFRNFVIVSSVLVSSPIQYGPAPADDLDLDYYYS